METVNPADKILYPEIEKCLDELTSWDWIYGKTPPFTIERNFENKISNKHKCKADLKVRIEKGHLTNLQLKLLTEENIDLNCVHSLESSLEGCRLCREDVIGRLTQVKTDWISRDCYSVQTREVLDWCLQCILQGLSV